MFYTDQKPTILDCVNQQTQCLFCWCARWHVFITKTNWRQYYSFYKHLLNRLGFGETAIDHFYFQNNKTKDMLVYQLKVILPSWYLFTCKHFHWVCYTYFVHRNLGQRSEKYTIWKQHWFWSKRMGTQHAAKLQPSVQMKSYTVHEDMSARFLIATNTDFKLYITNLSATVHSKLSQHLKSEISLHNTQKKACGRK